MGFEKVEYFENGFIKVHRNDKYNIINKQNKVLSSIWFDYMYDFKEDFAQVVKNRKWNHINTNGVLLSNVWFDYAGIFINGFALLLINSNVYWMRRDGNIKHGLR